MSRAEGRRSHAAGVSKDMMGVEVRVSETSREEVRKGSVDDIRVRTGGEGLDSGSSSP